MTMLEMSSLLLGNKTRCSNPSIIHLNYNILPTKMMSSSAHSVRGMDGSFSVTTTRKEVGKTSRVFTQVLVSMGYIFWTVLSWHKAAKLTLIPSWDWRRKGDGPGPRDHGIMSVRDTKLNVCERHKTGRKWDGLGPRDLSSWRDNLVTRADSPLSRTAAKIW